MKYGYLWVLYFVIILTGWVINLMNVINYESAEVTTQFVFQAIGIFLFPLGTVLGYVR